MLMVYVVLVVTARWRMCTAPSTVVAVTVPRAGVARSPLCLNIRIRTVAGIPIAIAAAVVIVVGRVVALTRVLRSRIIGVGWLE